MAGTRRSAWTRGFRRIIPFGMLLGYWDNNRFLSNQRVALRQTMQGTWKSSAAVPVIGENDSPASNVGPQALSLLGCCPDICPVAWHKVRAFMMINGRLTMQGS